MKCTGCSIANIRANKTPAEVRYEAYRSGCELLLAIQDGDVQVLQSCCAIQGSPELLWEVTLFQVLLRDSRHDVLQPRRVPSCESSQHPQILRAAQRECIVLQLWAPVERACCHPMLACCDMLSA